MLHPEIVEHYSDEFVEVDMPAEILFDFKAGELQGDLFFDKPSSENEMPGVTPRC